MRPWFANRRRREAELEEELRFHLQEEAELRQAAGMSDAEAKSAARRELGNLALVKEDTRSVWTWVLWEQFRQDFRYAARMLRRTPGFTCAAVLSLALGVGANTAIFSLLDALVFRSLPVSEPRQLVQLNYTGQLWGNAGMDSTFDYPHLERFRQESRTLSGVFASTRMGRLNLGFRGTSAVAQADATTDNFFSVLGLQPQLGRFFAAGEDDTRASVAVLSNRYWRSRFRSDPAIIGAEAVIDQVPFTIIGVTPPEFLGTSVGYEPDVWVTLHGMERIRNEPLLTEAFGSWLQIVGRLQTGVSREQAQSELDVIHRSLVSEQLPHSELRTRPDMQRFVRESRLILSPAATGTISGLRDRYAFSLKLLLFVAGIVLLIACANLANLLLARASSRRREIAVRIALGAARGRLVRQLLTESIVLAAAGCVCGLALARWGGIALTRMIATGDSSMPLDVRTDWHTFAFAAVVSLLTGILFGLAPALRATRIQPSPSLKESSGQMGHRRRPMDRLLVIAQVALSVVLITGAAMFALSLQRLWSVDLGFARQNIFLFSLDAKLAGYSHDRAGALYRQVLRNLQSLPQVQSVSASAVRPFDDNFYLVDAVNEIDGRALPPSGSFRVVWNSVSPGYFSTISTPLLSGRDFEDKDGESAPPVAIVNESFASRAFPGQSPIGHRIAFATIIGVVKDSHYSGAREQPRPEIYYQLFQHGKQQEFRWGFVSFELLCRNCADLSNQVRKQVAAVNPDLPVFGIRTLEAQVGQSLLRERLLAVLSAFFGALALVLACVGLYGLMAYSVARRTSEIGLRAALGARTRHVLSLVLGETLMLTLAGLVAGLLIAVWAARFVQSLLFDITATDPLIIVSAVAIMIGVSALASYLPARLALKIDPATALRYE